MDTKFPLRFTVKMSVRWAISMEHDFKYEMMEHQTQRVIVTGRCTTECETYVHDLEGRWRRQNESEFVWNQNGSALLQNTSSRGHLHLSSFCILPLPPPPATRDGPRPRPQFSIKTAVNQSGSDRGGPSSSAERAKQQTEKGRRRERGCDREREETKTGENREGALSIKSRETINRQKGEQGVFEDGAWNLWGKQMGQKRVWRIRGNIEQQQHHRGAAAVYFEYGFKKKRKMIGWLRRQSATDSNAPSHCTCFPVIFSILAIMCFPNMSFLKLGTSSITLLMSRVLCATLVTSSSF